jgi:hypothetical protein
MIEPADVLELPQGQAFALLEGNRRFKIRIPLADARNDEFVPQSLQNVAAQMKARYRTSEQWASETDWFTENWLNSQPIADGTGMIATDLAVQDPDPDDDTQSNSAINTDTMGLITRGHG